MVPSYNSFASAYQTHYQVLESTLCIPASFLLTTVRRTSPVLYDDKSVGIINVLLYLYPREYSLVVPRYTGTPQYCGRATDGGTTVLVYYPFLFWRFIVLSQLWLPGVDGSVVVSVHPPC